MKLCCILLTQKVRGVTYLKWVLQNRDKLVHQASQQQFEIK
jgi:hypothetical protein